ncbi:MAG: DUF4920 domain-containing protein [Myxococcota bacterium]
MRFTTFALFALVACGGTPESAPEGTPEAGHEAEAKMEGEHHEGHHEGHEKAAAATVENGWAHYGDAFATAEAMDCKELIANPDAKLDQTVRVTGRIDNVCQKAGCWMVIADDDGNYLRVTMKEHAFGVPTDTKTGDTTLADIEGTLIKKELDAKTLEHLKSEAKGSPEELEKQFAPKYEIIATGVSVKQG